MRSLRPLTLLVFVAVAAGIALGIRIYEMLTGTPVPL